MEICLAGSASVLTSSVLMFYEKSMPLARILHALLHGITLLSRMGLRFWHGLRLMFSA
jgi:hypothetical protein